MPESPFSLFSPFSQVIKSFVNEPVTNWQHFFNPQVNFNYNPQDAPVEAHVLSRVGSYGSQLSTLIDAINVLQMHLPRAGLAPAEINALDAFVDLRNKAAQAVEEFNGNVTVDSIVSAAESLQQRDPGSLAQIRAKLDALRTATK